MKIITLGNGFIANHLPYEIVNERLTSDKWELAGLLSKYKPDVIINCVGFCGRPNVDQCEVERAKTYMSNVVLPLALADACHDADIQMIHIGSGCIYFGESPHKNMYLTERRGNTIQPGDPNYFYGAFELADAGWKETDFANPKSYYSKTKYACDLALGQMDNVTTLRIRMPISTKNTDRNFINKVKGYSKVIDIPNSVTFIDDLVGVVNWAIEEQKTGIYHVVNPEPLTAADVMREYQKYVTTHNFEIITEEQLDQMTTAKRSNCILNSDKLRNDGFEMTPSKEALASCMAEYAKSL